MRWEPVVGAAGGRSEVGVEGVDASLDPLRPTCVVLVPEGVGQALDRRSAVDEQAIAVEPGVDLGQRLGAVAGQDLDGGPPERHATDRDGPGCGRWERGRRERRRAATPLPRQRRPEPVTELRQLLDGSDPLVRHGHGGGIDLLHTPEEGAAPLLGPPTGHPGHAARHPVEEQVGAATSGASARPGRTAVRELAAVGILVIGAHRLRLLDSLQVAVVDRDPEPKPRVVIMPKGCDIEADRHRPSARARPPTPHPTPHPSGPTGTCFAAASVGESTSNRRRTAPGTWSSWGGGAGWLSRPGGWWRRGW